MQTEISPFVIRNLTRIASMLTVLALPAASPAQDTLVLRYGNYIQAANLKDYLQILASDALEGRETGKRGQKMAAAFISAHFAEAGLKPPVDSSYYQLFQLYLPERTEVTLRSGNEQFRLNNDFVYSGVTPTRGEITANAIFCGKGRDQDIKSLDLNGKAAVVLVSRSEITGTFDHIYSKGATMIFFVSPIAEEYAATAAQVRNNFARAPLSLEKYDYGEGRSGAFYINQKTAEKLFGTPMPELIKAANADPAKSSLRKIKECSLSFQVSMGNKTVSTENVLGFVPGDKKQDEVLVITAHYDHIGKRRSGEGDLINNGADDDGSGTVAVMEMARVFAKAKAEGHGPARSILFMAVTAEEQGLLGSLYYTRNPIFPLSKTIANLNIDMIGRRDEKHKASPPYLYVIGSDKISTALHQLSERTNNTYSKLVFDYVYNDEAHPDRLYYRSDHWNFAQKNIPIIFYFDGIHEDYHRVTDQVDKIDFELLHKRTQCIFYTAWEIANRSEWLERDVKK